jgi:hypothetical protein
MDLNGVGYCRPPRCCFCRTCRRSIIARALVMLAMAGGMPVRGQDVEDDSAKVWRITKIDRDARIITVTADSKELLGNVYLIRPSVQSFDVPVFCSIYATNGAPVPFSAVKVGQMIKYEPGPASSQGISRPYGIASASRHTIKKLWVVSDPSGIKVTSHWEPSSLTLVQEERARLNYSRLPTDLHNRFEQGRQRRLSALRRQIERSGGQERTDLIAEFRSVALNDPPFIPIFADDAAPGDIGRLESHGTVYSVFNVSQNDTLMVNRQTRRPIVIGPGIGPQNGMIEIKGLPAQQYATGQSLRVDQMVVEMVGGMGMKSYKARPDIQEALRQGHAVQVSDTVRAKEHERKEKAHQAESQAAKEHRLAEAARKLRLAKDLLADNPAAAHRRLQEIVKDYADTPAGQEAKTLLEK